MGESKLKKLAQDFMTEYKKNMSKVDYTPKFEETNTTRYLSNQLNSISNSISNGSAGDKFKAWLAQRRQQEAEQEVKRQEEQQDQMEKKAENEKIAPTKEDTKKTVVAPTVKRTQTNQYTDDMTGGAFTTNKSQTLSKEEEQKIVEEMNKKYGGNKTVEEVKQDAAKVKEEQIPKGKAEQWTDEEKREVKKTTDKVNIEMKLKNGQALTLPQSLKVLGNDTTQVAKTTGEAIAMIPEQAARGFARKSTIRAKDMIDQRNRYIASQTPIAQQKLAEHGITIQDPENDFEKSLSNKIEGHQYNIAQNSTETYSKAGKAINDMMPSNVQSLMGMIPVVGQVGFSLSAYDGYYSDAEAKGMNRQQADKFASVMSYMETISEMLLRAENVGKIKNAVGTKLGKEIVKEGTEKATKETAKSFMKSGIKNAIKDTAINAAENAVQEASTEVYGQIFENIALGKKAFYGFDKDLLERMKSAAGGGAQQGLFMDLATAAITGALGGGSGTISRKQAPKTYEVLGKISKGNEVTTEEYKSAISELSENGVNVKDIAQDHVQDFLASEWLKQEIDNTDKQEMNDFISDVQSNQNQNVFDILESRINSNKEVSQNIEQNIDNNVNQTDVQEEIPESLKNINKQIEESNKDKTQTTLSEIRDTSKEGTYQFEKSDNARHNALDESVIASNLNNSQETHNLTNCLKSLMDKRDNLHILFDNTIVDNNGRAVNGKITQLANNEVEIRINPNSDKSVEWILMHELTHDVGTDQMRKYVAKFVEKMKGGKEALRDLDNLYKGQGTKADEALSDICANIMGTQEFIDSLGNTSEVRTFKQKVADFFKGISNHFTTDGKISNMVNKLTNMWNASYKTGNSNFESDFKYSILSDSKNRKYVKADRQVISGNNSLRWEQQVENYINNNIRQGKDVNVLADDGTVLTITENTAGKAKFRNEIIDKNGQKRKLNNTEFQAKLRAETHIDELAEISKQTNKKIVPDYKNHKFAKDGFNYRTAYFEDFDGKYYKITMSVGKNGNINTIYNVGKMNEKNRSKSSLVAQRPSDVNNITSNEDLTSKYSIAPIKENVNGEKNSEKSSFSLRDNKGRKLTDEQIKRYKDVSDDIKDADGNIERFYHGTRRADRVGNEFDPNKATSGPMAFFTNSIDVAENYSKDKADTSLSREYDTEKDLFKVDGKSLDEYWNSLSLKEKEEINEKAKNISFDDDYENIVYDENYNTFGTQYDYYLKHETNNNGIDALYKVFIEDGNLFGEDVGKFKEALELAGIKNIEYLDPYKVDSKVYEVYLNLKNPFNTEKISDDIYNQLKEASKDATIGEQYSADAWDKSNITPEAWMKKLDNDIAEGTTHAWTVIPDWVTDVLKQNGYDGIVDKGGKGGGLEHKVAIPFYSNQIKNIDNTNPTDSNDIRYNLPTREDIGKKWDAFLNKNFKNNGTQTYGKEIQRQIAPLMNEVKTLREEIKNIAPVGNREYNNNEVNTYGEMEGKISTTQNDEESRQYSGERTEQNVRNKNTERETEIKQYRDTIRQVLKDEIQGKLGFDENKALTVIDRVIDGENVDRETVLDAFDGLRDIEIEIDGVDRNLIKEIRQHIRETKLDVSKYKNEITDYNDFRKFNMGKIKIGNDGTPIDSFYQELSSMYPDFFSGDATHPVDQLERIAEFMNSKDDLLNSTEIYTLKDEDLDEIVRYLQDGIGGLKELENGSFFVEENESNENLDSLVKEIDEQERKGKIAPIKEENKTIAPLRGITNDNFNDVINTKIVTNRKVKPSFGALKTKVSEYSNGLYQALVNKMHPIDQKAKRTGNTRLRDLGQATLVSQGKGQYNIGVAQTDYHSNRIGKSINDIFGDNIKNEELSRYLYLKENVIRAENGKNIFGGQISAENSKILAEQLEANHPEYKKILDEVVKYGDDELQLLVDAGMISKADAKTIKEKNPLYVPVERLVEAQMKGPTGEITSGKGVKKAKFGSADIMSAPEAMANRTVRLRNKIALNELIKELAKTNKQYESAHAGDTRYNTETLDSGDIEDLHFALDAEMDVDSIFDPENNAVTIDKDGNYKATYFEDGVGHTFNITKAEYDALKQHESNALEDFATATLGRVSNIHRDILTKWSATFPAKNAIKDIQDVTLNSKYIKEFPKNYVKAVKEIGSNSELWNTYLANGGGSLSYYDYTKGLNGKDGKIKSVFKYAPEKISSINEVIEQLPRFTEFISTIEAGKTVEEAMYNAAEITTNFSRGGEITKALNRSGATFLNASVQGFDKFFRNFTGQNGARAFVGTLAKGVAFGMIPALFNHLWYDDDEDYQDLRDSDKDLYYLFKYDDGKFIRIPKGRALSVFGTAARRTLSTIQGEEDSYDGMFETMANQIAPNNPFSDNVIAPIIQAKNNKTWYGGDIVSSRLQKEKNENQYDENTSSMSIWLGKKTGMSPKKIDYVLDQYSGGVGDVVLPMTRKAAYKNVFEDQFTTDSVLKNRNVGKFYDTISELTKIANDPNATADDLLKLEYMSEVNKNTSELYNQKREIQNSNLSNKEKGEKVREIQAEINKVMKEGLNNYKTIEKNDKEDVAKIGDSTYLKIEGNWKSLSDSDKEHIAAVVSSGGKAEDYYRYKIDTTYRDEETGNLKTQKSSERVEYLNNSNMSSKAKEAIYEECFEDETYRKTGVGIDTYLDYKNKVNKVSESKGENKQANQKEKIDILLKSKYSNKDIQKLYETTVVTEQSDLYKALKKTNINIKEWLKYTQEDLSADKYDDGTLNGKSVSGSKKNKVYAYVSNMDISYEQKLMIVGSQYTLNNSEQSTLANYINNINMSQKEKLELYSKMKGFKVYKNGRVTW